MAGKLRAMKPGEAALRRRRPLSIVQAAASGDERALLVALRERIARTVTDPGCPPRDLAALSRRLQELSKDIAAIDVKCCAGEGGGAAGDSAWDDSAV
jgi:hypothetical protein